MVDPGLSIVVDPRMAISGGGAGSDRSVVGSNHSTKQCSLKSNECLVGVLPARKRAVLRRHRLWPPPTPAETVSPHESSPFVASTQESSTAPVHLPSGFP